MNYRNFIKVSALMLILSSTLFSCSEDEVTQYECGGPNILCGSISANKTLEEGIYELAGKVIVENGATLTINPGTIIKGREGAGTESSALIITRGAKIMAEGTASEPIIFTSVLDNIQLGEMVGTSLGENDHQKWGGLLILGNAPISAKDGDTQGQIEGIPANESYGTYGGTNPTDNSGVLKYVSVRHGGTKIGEANEINGITFGGVGSGTVVDYVEVVANLDDGFEFFGGTVNVTNALVAFQGDDAFDIDQNYAGTLDNIMAIQGGADTDNALEIDGPENASYTTGKFTVKNGTFMGDKAAGGTLTRAATFKDKAQGTVMNCFFSDYSKWMRVRASWVDSVTYKTDAYTHYITTADLVITNVQCATTLTPAEVIACFDEPATGEESKVTSVEENEVDAVFTNSANNNQVVNPNGGTVGANTSKFQGWTWAYAKGKIQ